MRPRTWFPVLLTPALALTLALAGCSKQNPPTSPAKAPARSSAKVVDEAMVAQGAPTGALLLWPAPRDFEARIGASGVPAFLVEHDEFHAHVHLEVYRNGEQVVVPPNIGVEVGGKRVAPIHTHAPTGVIHVESPDARVYTLGEFFALWGVPLDGAKATVDDEPAPNPAAIPFNNLALITVMFGE